MATSKNFRLFISSTFSDFQKEREVLQTKVFPHIKEYASQKGYRFQPIDLRWGVSSEAQLDQKTLDLCLSEVRACKTHLNPNFLIMIGNRYGWIPLPFAVEVEEFEELYRLSTDMAKTVLDKWYIKDLNQIPASYILQERKGDYIEFEKWDSVEEELREIFQEAVTKSHFQEEQQRKYFLSATEAEVEEGIIPYINPTKFQKNTLMVDSKLMSIDPKHIFCFLRDVTTEKGLESKFRDTDTQKVDFFKKSVKEVLPTENTLEIQTSQISRTSLDEIYLKEFQERVTSFLLEQVDAQRAQEEKQKLSPLDMELLAQKYFASLKRKNFLGQEQLRKIIAEYLTNKSNQILVVYGESGRGKSALIAKTVEEAQKQSSKRVIYRFIGATPSSSLSKELVMSILEELGDPIELEEEESFEEFSQRAAQKIEGIFENVVIFIDAIDQLQNPDPLLWLPNNLPSNMKIVISALEDINYKEDSKYLDYLRDKTDQVYKIALFDEPSLLLHTLLNEEERSVDEVQKAYFLEQYAAVQSPLYIHIAIEEMKTWKSGDTTQKLAGTQKGIIKEFINNLTTRYHHDSKFVQKVLGFLYASRDGLSEYELLELLAQDKSFIEMMAPETWHQNSTQELPLIHWSRLQTQLKPFLTLKTHDGEELIYFFHREFEDAIKEQDYQKYEHKKIIKSVQSLILKNQVRDFQQFRWGKLYMLLTQRYLTSSDITTEQKEFVSFIIDLKNSSWKEQYLKELEKIGLNDYLNSRMFEAIVHQENYLLIAKTFYGNQSFKLINALNNLATTYKYQNRQSDAIVLEEESIVLVKKFYFEDKTKWALTYNTTLNNLARSYYNKNRVEDAIRLEEESLEIAKENYVTSPELWMSNYTRTLVNLARSYYNYTLIEKGIPLLEEALKIRKEYFLQNPQKWARHYTISLNDLAFSYKAVGKTPLSIPLEEEALEIRTELYTNNPSQWGKEFTRSLNNLATSYKIEGHYEKAMGLEVKSYTTMKELYESNQNRWAKDFTISLNNLGVSYRNINKLDKAIELEKEALSISENLYSFDASRWAEFYLRGMQELALSYEKRGLVEDALILEEKYHLLIQNLYKENPKRWIKEFNSRNFLCS